MKLSVENDIISDVIEQTPIGTIGLLGSVADGKSTLVFATTGTKTQRYQSEQVRNITIKPGYANIKIWESDNNYYSTSSNQYDYEINDKKCNLVHHLSFVDCPGHQELILTMLSSIKLMHNIIIVVSAEESITKKPQLIQHLKAIKLSNIKNVIVCLNKLDLVDKKIAMERYNELKKVLEEYDIEPLSIIPTSFSRKIGVGSLLEDIIKFFPKKIYDEKSKSYFLTTRSFDINRKGIDYTEISGGVLGGSCLSGKLKVGDEIEIKPGILSVDSNKKIISKSIITKIQSIQTDTSSLDELFPGSLAGLKTDIDPFYCKNDSLSGNVIGLVGTLPPTYDNIKLKYKIIEEFVKNWKPKVDNTIYLQIETNSISSKISSINDDVLEVILSKPMCIFDDTMIVISHKENNMQELVGIGKITS